MRFLDKYRKKEDERLASEAAEARGEAKALTAVGGVGGVAWALLEGGAFVGDVVDTTLRMSKAEAKTWKKIGMVSLGVGLGAVIVALCKHSHAHKLEEQRRRNAEESSVNSIS